MFGLSGGSDKVKALADLNIVPLCISYEWEPCDILKALELYARSSGSLLGSGSLTAHEKHRLMLLGSPPDMVHGFPLRRTGSSTLLTGVRQHKNSPRSGIHPCCSGLQVTGHR